MTLFKVSITLKLFGVNSISGTRPPQYAKPQLISQNVNSEVSKNPISTDWGQELMKYLLKLFHVSMA